MPHRYKYLCFTAMLLVTALLCPLYSRADGPAGWSWLWSPDGYRPPETVFFRVHFHLARIPVHAVLLITADDGFTAFLNGSTKPAAAGSDWTTVQEIDITRYLQAGDNLLAVEAYNRSGPGGLIYKLRFGDVSGHTTALVSTSRALVNRRPPPRWTAPDLNDSSWPHAAAIAPANGGPWGPLRGAPVPDPSRLVRIWDIRSGGKPGDNPYTRPRQSGDRMLLSSSESSATDMQILAGAGFSLFQFDSPVLSTEMTGPGQYDFREPLSALAAARRLGVDWCYNTHEAFPPPWYRDKVPFTRIECTEHHEPVQAFSPWEPRWSGFVDQAFGAMSTTLTKQAGVAALDVGIHGDYGEAGLLTGARVSVPTQRADWEKRFGNTHDHLGWWCADQLATADFRARMLKKYGSLDAINAAWKRTFRMAGEISFPDKPRAEARQEWLDFVDWYDAGVSHAVEINLNAARKYFPDALRMLPAGLADEDPRGGNDNSLLPKVAAELGAALRSAHGGAKPVAENAATMFGRLGSAARFYGAPFWSEPPGGLTADQEVGRIFEAVSQGAQGFFEWSDTAVSARDVFYRYGKYLTVQKPVVDVAMFYPAEAQKLRPDQGYAPLFERGCSILRDVANFDIVDDRMVKDGCLSHYRVLALWEGTMSDADTLQKIKEWVNDGGVIVAYDFGKVATFSGDTSWFSDLFGYVQQLAPARLTERYSGAVPDQYRISVANPEAAGYLAGDWYPPETQDGATFRWAGARASVKLPLNPSRSYVVVVRAYVPPDAEHLARRVLLNDRDLGRVDASGDISYRFVISPESIGDHPLSTLTFDSETFAGDGPASEAHRQQGIRVESISVIEQGVAERADAAHLTGTLGRALDLRLLRDEWTRRYGKGLTIYFPASRQLLNGYIEVLRRVIYRLSSIDTGRRDAIDVDDSLDGVYSTLFSDRILYYNSRDVPVTKTVSIPADSFAGWQDTITTPDQNSWKLTLEPHSIGAVYFTPPPQELLLECEKFLDLGQNRILSSPDCSPAKGPTCVRVPGGAAISTRFPVDVAGDYTIYTRCLGASGPEAVDVILDGQAVKPVDAKAGQTILSGTINLGKGAHTLSLRPRGGHTVRADFVLLSSDRTVAGYNFAVRTAAID